MSFIDDIINGLMGFFTGTYNWIESGLAGIVGFVNAISAMLSVISQFYTGFMYPLFSANAGATAIFSIITLGIGIIISIRIYNILAEIEIFGWKLPKL